ncbi:MAG TPA: PAS domain S-box protein, partial [Anaerolineales bacterium]|nr:PAS domain S-box protein [Anaerolineales bacterium]
MSISSHERDDHPLYVNGDPRQIVRIFYWFTALILLSLLSGGIISFLTQSFLAVALLLASVPFVLIPLWFIRQQKVELAASLLAVVLLSLLTVLATYGLGIHQISNLGFPAVLIIASLVTRKRTMVFLTAFAIGCAAWLVFGELYGVYTPVLLVQSMPGDFVSVAVALLITAIMVRFLTEAFFKNSLLLQQELKERKRAEEKYRNIFENTIDGIFQSTVDGRFVNVNRSMARMYGYESPEEMLRMVQDISKQIYVSPEQRDILVQKLSTEYAVVGFEAEEYRKDGSTFWISANIRTVFDEAGNILYYEGTVEDISLRKMVEMERKQAEDRLLQFRKLMDEANDSIFLIDPQTSRYIDFN